MYKDLRELYGETLSATDVAHVIHCHPVHVREMCRNGELPAIKIGSRWRVPTAKLAAMLEGSGDE